MATDCATNVGCLVKLIGEEPVRLADEVGVCLLWSSLPDRAVSSGSNSEATLIGSEVHLLLRRSLEQRPSRASAGSEIRLVAAVPHLLHDCRLRILSNHLLICSLHMASRGLHLAHGHPLLALRRTAGIQNARLRPLLLVLNGVVWLRCLHGRHGLLLYATLPDLVIIIILHLIRLNHLVRLVPLRWLLLQALSLYVRVLDHNLFVLLLDHLLVLHRLWLRGLSVLLASNGACMALLLLRYPLLLLRWALVPILVAIFIVEEALERLDELRLLVLDIFLVGVAGKVDVLAFTGLLHG